jgi:hypothetical protein
MLTWPGIAHAHMRLQIPALPAAACLVPSLPEFPPGYLTPGSSPYSVGPGLLPLEPCRAGCSLSCRCRNPAAARRLQCALLLVTRLSS